MQLDYISPAVLTEIAYTLYDVHGVRMLDIADIQIQQLESEDFNAAANAWRVLKSFGLEIHQGKELEKSIQIN